VKRSSVHKGTPFSVHLCCAPSGATPWGSVEKISVALKGRDKTVNHGWILVSLVILRQRRFGVGAEVFEDKCADVSSQHFHSTQLHVWLFSVTVRTSEKVSLPSVSSSSPSRLLMTRYRTQQPSAGSLASTLSANVGRQCASDTPNALQAETFSQSRRETDAGRGTLGIVDLGFRKMSSVEERLDQLRGLRPRSPNCFSF
jgi:hypothetical protein